MSGSRCRCGGRRRAAVIWGLDAMTAAFVGVQSAASAAPLAMINDELLDRGRSHGRRIDDAEWLAARAGV